MSLVGAVATDTLVFYWLAAIAFLICLAPKAAGNLTVRGVSGGIASFELAGTAQRVETIIRLWRSAQRLQNARPALYWDFAFIASYVATFGLGCVLATRWLLTEADARAAATLSQMGTTFIVLVVLAAAFDVLENISLLRILAAYGVEQPRDPPAASTIQVWARAARGCATAKFALLVLVLLFLIAIAGMALGHLEWSALAG